MNKALGLIFVTLILTQTIEAKDWRGIVPLRSTRADVERLLGQPEKGLGSIYQTGSETISVSYSEKPCDYGWQVPLNTVISIIVHPKNPLGFATLKLDERKYEKRKDPHHEYLYYYVNQEEGINYTLDAEAGVVKSIEYYSPSKDNTLRCANAMNSPGGTKHIIRFDEYVNAPANQKKRLDSFAAALRQDATQQGYVLVYAGRRSRPDEAQVKALWIRNYLVKMKRLDDGRIHTINGGHREQATVELYLVPSGATPPSPTQTLRPEEIRIINNRGKKRGSVHNP